jgi:hypothetical protein
MITNKPIILVGGPDSGKSNYLARLWLAFRSERFDLKPTATPEDIKYIESIAAHLLRGKFVPRTDKDDNIRDFSVEVISQNKNITAQLVVPDMYGEIWEKAVRTLEIPEKWLNSLRNSSNAMIFVRVQSENNFEPLDWVVSQKLLKNGFGDEASNSEIPTQITLIELLRFINDNVKRAGKTKPKVAVIVTAWDLLHADEQAEGPEKYLKKQFPMFSGRLDDIDSLEVKVFGSSIVGGDFKVQDFLKAFLDKEIDDAGYIVFQEGDKSSEEIKDLTEPINWLLS